MPTSSFQRFAGICAILAGIAAFLYAVAFVVISRSNPAMGAALSALFLLLIGIVTIPVMTGLYSLLRETAPDFALLALLLGVIGAAGSAIHGGYDLANAIHPPSEVNMSFPSQIDPRGLLTFGIAGLAVFFLAWLLARAKHFPAALSFLGYLLAVLLVVIYLGRLIILDPTHPLLVATILPTGFLINPIWYIWLGLILRRRSA